MNEKRTFNYDGQTYTYRLITSRRKSTQLQFDKDGSWIVKSWYGVNETLINQYLTTHLNEIKQKQQLYLKQHARRFNGCENNQYFYCLNKLYLIKVISADKNQVYFDGGYLIVESNGKTQVDKLIEKFANKLALELFQQGIKHYAAFLKDYHLNEPTLSIKKMTSRWGSCNWRKNKINLNRYLIHYDRNFINYVIIHELAHLIVHDHSRAFYQLVERYEPRYRIYRKLDRQ